MTPTAAVRSILGDYVSEARCREVVVAVLRACREPTRGMLDDGCSVGPDTNSGPFDDFNATYVFTAMIDALIEEVTAEGGRGAS